jgi:DNA-binding MarR family transcriptional regulator
MSVRYLLAPLMVPFSFLTNHAHALLAISNDPQIRMREVAEVLGLTERAAQRIVGDLVKAGYVTKVREGRRNVYTVKTDQSVPLSGERKLQVGDLLEVLGTQRIAA